MIKVLKIGVIGFVSIAISILAFFYFIGESENKFREKNYEYAKYVVMLFVENKPVDLIIKEILDPEAMKVSAEDIEGYKKYVYMNNKGFEKLELIQFEEYQLNSDGNNGNYKIKVIYKDAVFVANVKVMDTESGPKVIYFSFKPIVGSDLEKGLNETKL